MQGSCPLHDQIDPIYIFQVTVSLYQQMNRYIHIEYIIQLNLARNVVGGDANFVNPYKQNIH